MRWKLTECKVIAPYSVIVTVKYECPPKDRFYSEVLWEEVKQYIEAKYGLLFQQATETAIYPIEQTGTARFTVKGSSQK